MTRKDFEFIAKVIRDMPDHAPMLRSQKISIAHAFANALQSTNRLFNRDRFIKACLKDLPGGDDDI